MTFADVLQTVIRLLVTIRERRGNTADAQKQEIERLVEDNKRFQKLNVELAERVAAQSELLSRRAERN